MWYFLGLLILLEFDNNPNIYQESNSMDVILLFPKLGQEINGQGKLSFLVAPFNFLNQYAYAN